MPGNLWKLLEISWKNHGILLLWKSGNPVFRNPIFRAAGNVIQQLEMYGLRINCTRSLSTLLEQFTSKCSELSISSSPLQSNTGSHRNGSWMFLCNIYETSGISNGKKWMVFYVWGNSTRTAVSSANFSEVFKEEYYKLSNAMEVNLVWNPLRGFELTKHCKVKLNCLQGGFHRVHWYCIGLGLKLTSH